MRFASETETSEYDSEVPDSMAPDSAPQIIQAMKDFRLIEGADATFVCRIIGKPRPKVSWNVLEMSAVDTFGFAKVTKSVNRETIETVLKMKFFVKTIVIDDYLDDNIGLKFLWIIYVDFEMVRWLEKIIKKLCAHRDEGIFWQDG